MLLTQERSICLALVVKPATADPNILFTQNQCNVLPPYTQEEPADVHSVSAGFLFVILYKTVRNDPENAEDINCVSVLRGLKIFTREVLKISFLCDSTFCPSLCVFVFCPEDGSIMCVRNVKYWKVRNVTIVILFSGGFRLQIIYSDTLNSRFEPRFSFIFCVPQNRQL